MASISLVKESIKICRYAGVTLFIWGQHGLGKSSVVRQMCSQGLGETIKLKRKDDTEHHDYKLPMGFIDMRCSQIEASDLRGLPDKVNGRTTYLPPADMPIGDLSAEEIELHLSKIDDPEAQRAERERMQPHYKRGILFLDELNRAADDVLQAAFQLVLDGRIGQYVKPAGWQVVVAGNYTEGYQVNGFTDSAFLDRFCHIDLTAGEPTLEEWIRYMAQNHGTKASEVIEFCSGNLKYLDGEMKAERGFTRQPSRRSWEAAVRVLDSKNTDPSIDDRAITEVLAGLLGREVAIAFQKYSCPVKPLDILTHGIERYRKVLSTLVRGQLLGVMWGVISFAKDKVQKDKHTCEVCLDLAEFLLKSHSERDVVIAFCRNLLITGNQEADRLCVASLTNPDLTKIMTKLMGNSNMFMACLQKRTELHSLIQKYGWGETSTSK